MKIFGKVVVFALALVVLGELKEDYFTSISYLENLLYTEAEIIRIIRNYLQVEENKLQHLKWFQKQLKDQHQNFANKSGDYPLNPISSYLMIKRLSEDLSDLIYLTEVLNSKQITEIITERNLDLPKLDDLKGASDGILRLQDTYSLNATEMFSILGNDSTEKLTADDCYYLGLQAYSSKRYDCSLNWMEQALRRIDTEPKKTHDKIKILDYMADAAHKSGDIARARDISLEMIQTDPSIYQAYEKLAIYQELLASNVDLRKPKTKHPHFSYGDIQDRYSKLCRRKGESKDESKLRCFYTNNNNSFLLLQPVKVEQFSLKPHIVLYHNVVSDAEIETIRDLSKPLLERARVSDISTGAEGFVPYRISKSAYFPDDEHEIIGRLSRRIQIITGLSLSTAEILHVINYGIGGQYEPHHDFSFIDDFEELEGNRIATWIFYLNEVKSGGATVFPRIGVKVKPLKGSAIFWYNLFRNGSVILDTQHAGCPVLSGSKWIATKWFHERAQEFSRPCSINREE